MSGLYIFRVPFIYSSSSSLKSGAFYFDKGTKYFHHAPYRSTGVHRVEYQALKLRRLLRKEKITFTWHERKLKDYVKITVRF